MSNLHLKYWKSEIKWGYNFLRYCKSKFHVDLSLKKKKKKSIISVKKKKKKFHVD